MAILKDGRGEMIIDKARLNRIGVDRIIINNFKILNFDELDRKMTTTSSEYTEKIEQRSSLFSLSYSINLNADNEIYAVSSLEINPNKIIEGHNIYNSGVRELKESLEKVLSIMKSNGMDIDMTEAKIKEIEINSTFKQDFKELEEVLLLIGRANYKKALGMYSFAEEDIPKKIKTERSLYMNHKMPYNKIGITGKAIKIYDKSFEVLRNDRLALDVPLTRVEILLGRDYYRTWTNRLKLSNSLKDLLMNENILEHIFKISLEEELLTKPEAYLKKVLKRRLEKDFNRFKRNEKKKREERKRLKEQGKEIPELYKEERGVLEFLDKESWIFDWSYLLEIVLKIIPSKHHEAYKRQIMKKYLNKNNLTIYERFLTSNFLR